MGGNSSIMSYRYRCKQFVDHLWGRDHECRIVILLALFQIRVRRVLGSFSFDLMTFSVLFAPRTR